MRKKLVAEILVFAFLCVSTALARESTMLVAAESKNEVQISGLVEKPLTLTTAELLSFPMISEGSLL